MIAENKEKIQLELNEVEQKITKIKLKKEESLIDLQFYASELKWCKSQIMQFVNGLLDQA